MGFTVTDFREWVNILYEHPEWQKELRRLVLTDELLELPNLFRELAELQRQTDLRIDKLAEAQRRTEQRVEELAEAQRRTEQRVEELAEAQRRTEQRVEELAEAQRRTEQRVEELAEAQRQTQLRVDELAEAQRQTQLRVDELAEAQRRTEQRVDELAEAQRRTEQRVEELAKAQRRTEQRVDKLGEAVGGLQNAFGATVEEEAAAVTEVVLRRKGYRILQPGYSLSIDGEIDVVLPLEDPAGEHVWAVVEAKARLGRRNVYRWAQRMHSVEWRRRLAEQGIPGPYLVYVYGIRADLSAHEVAQQQGIGLIKSDGEILAPRKLLEPVEANTSSVQ